MPALPSAMSAIIHLLELTAPLCLLVLLGYALARWGRWPKAGTEALTRFVFAVAVPALLFRLMSDFSNLPPVDLRLLVAFFGGCLVVFALGRLLARHLFALDGVGQSVACEKPLGRNVAEARRLVELARSANLRTAYFENQIFMKPIRAQLAQLEPVRRQMGPMALARSAEEHGGPHEGWF